MECKTNQERYYKQLVIESINSFASILYLNIIRKNEKGSKIWR